MPHPSFVGDVSRRRSDRVRARGARACPWGRASWACRADRRILRALRGAVGAAVGWLARATAARGCCAAAAARCACRAARRRCRRARLRCSGSERGACVECVLCRPCPRASRDVLRRRPAAATAVVRAGTVMRAGGQQKRGMAISLYARESAAGWRARRGRAPGVGWLRFTQSSSARRAVRQRIRATNNVAKLTGVMKMVRGGARRRRTRADAAACVQVASSKLRNIEARLHRGRPFGVRALRRRRLGQALTRGATQRSLLGSIADEKHTLADLEKPDALVRWPGGGGGRASDASVCPRVCRRRLGNTTFSSASRLTAACAVVRVRRGTCACARVRA